MVIVRRVVSYDAMLLRDVALRSLADSPAAFGRTLEQEQRNPPSYYENQARLFASSERTTAFLLCVGERVAGTIGAFLDEKDPSVAYLCAMWVEPSERRRGAGLKLVTEAMVWLRRLGARVVRAWVAERNIVGRAFWSSAGFRASSAVQQHPADPSESEILYVSEEAG